MSNPTICQDIGFKTVRKIIKELPTNFYSRIRNHEVIIAGGIFDYLITISYHTNIKNGIGSISFLKSFSSLVLS